MATTINAQRAHQSQFAQNVQQSGQLNLEQLKSDFLKLGDNEQHNAIMALRESSDPKLQKLSTELTKVWIQNVELAPPPSQPLTFAQQAEQALGSGTLNMEQLTADFLKLTSKEQHNTLMALRNSGDPRLQKLDIELTKAWVQNVELPPPPRE